MNLGSGWLVHCPLTMWHADIAGTQGKDRALERNTLYFDWMIHLKMKFKESIFVMVSLTSFDFAKYIEFSSY